MAELEKRPDLDCSALPGFFPAVYRMEFAKPAPSLGPDPHWEELRRNPRRPANRRWRTGTDCCKCRCHESPHSPCCDHFLSIFRAVCSKIWRLHVGTQPKSEPLCCAHTKNARLKYALEPSKNRKSGITQCVWCRENTKIKGGTWPPRVVLYYLQPVGPALSITEVMLIGSSYGAARIFQSAILHSFPSSLDRAGPVGAR